MDGFGKLLKLNTMINFKILSGIISFILAFSLEVQHSIPFDFSQEDNRLILANHNPSNSPGLGFILPLLLSDKPQNTIFFDDFSNSVNNNWQPINNTSLNSNWIISNNEYIQTEDVRSVKIGFDGSYKLGTYSLLKSGFDYANYEFSVDATFRELKTLEDIGILFRYQDDDNYYRVSFNGRYGFCRFEKKLNGQFYTLAVNGRGYQKLQTLHILIRAYENILQVFVNGDSMFNIIDNSHGQGTVALYTQDHSAFDNVQIKQVNTPDIVITSPLPYMVYEENSLTARAHIMGEGIGNFSVKFTLDNFVSPFVPDPFTHDFTNIEPGEHSIEAILYNDDEIPISSDNQHQVGTGGDYFITVGDSITNGSSDFYTSDNISSDMRIISTQGFQALLNNLLTEAKGYPHIIFNEGIPGDQSYDAADLRISSILERHPGFNKALILLGTNDALDPGIVTQSAFKINMETLIDQIPQDKNIWVALVPPVFGTGGYVDDVNQRIQGYNQEINNLARIQVGPDFYGFFLGNGGSSLFAADEYRPEYHPNALGHAIMAHLWNNHLTGRNFLPLFVDGLLPNNYKQNYLEEENNCYVDENFILTEIPNELKDGVWIMTAHAHRNNTSANFLSFTANRTADIYVAYDSSATQSPTWLNSFQPTDLMVQINGVSDFNVFRRSNVTGQVNLGGNLASPAQGASLNYLVILKEN